MTKWPESSAEWSVDNCHVISIEQLKVYEFRFNSHQNGRTLSVKWDHLQFLITSLTDLKDNNILYLQKLQNPRTTSWLHTVQQELKLRRLRV